jgi:endonuclease YncB( thermonuclease family)
VSKIFKVQSAFNSGVLDKRLLARIDTKQYFNGMEVGDNVLVLPQGGVRRRPGMEFIGDIGADCRVVPFIFSNEQAYALVFYENGIDVYYQDTFQVTVTTTYTADEIMDIHYTQSADTMILVHENHSPAILARLTDHDDWSISDMVFDFVPQYDFDDASSPTGVAEIQDITFNSFNDGQDFKLTVNGIDTEETSYSSDTATNEARITQAISDLVNVVYGHVTVAHQSGSTYRITLDGANADDWQAITGRAVSGSTSANITNANVQDGTPRTEDAWSSTRGWPRSVCFHEGRLWFGGSSSLPINLWGSRVNEFFNFDLGKSRDDQAIDITLDVAQFDAITEIFSNRHMQIFTGSGEFFIQASPITPENIAIKRQSGYGSKRIMPKVIDGATIYVQRTGRSLREFLFEFTEDAYISNTASLLSPDLIVDPVDMAVSVGTRNEDANYVYLVNGDGSMAIFNTLRSQDVAGWSLWKTEGNVKSACAVVDDIYFTVERTIDGVTKYYLEKANDNAFLDSSVIYTTPATDTLTGLDHLDGEECRVRADDSVLNNVTPASGEAVIDRVADDSAEVGLFFRPLVKTMPLEQDLGPGMNLAGEKRIVNCMLYVEETLGIKVNDYDIAFRSFGEGVLGKAVAPYTGKKEIYLLGWSKTAQVEITQDVPAPMTLIGIGIEMEIS